MRLNRAVLPAREQITQRISVLGIMGLNLEGRSIRRPRQKKIVMGKETVEKLILDSQTGLSMEVFLKLALKVVQRGRISNDGKEYCYLTAFDIDGDEYHLVSDLNSKSDKLTFYKANRHLENY